MNIAELDAAIGDAHRAFVDSSTCIAHFSTAEHTHPLARHLFGRVQDDGTSQVTAYEYNDKGRVIRRPIPWAGKRCPSTTRMASIS